MIRSAEEETVDLHQKKIAQPDYKQHNDSLEPLWKLLCTINEKLVGI